MPSAGFVPRALKVLLPVVVVAVASVAFAGCEASFSVGGDDGINADEAAKKIGQQYTQKTGIKVKSITCESGKPEVGATFTCDAVNEADTQLVFTATVDHVNGDKSNAHFNSHVTKATVKGTVFSDAAVKALAKEGTNVDSMSCPDEITLETGKKVNCTSTLPDGSERATVLTLTDKAGNFHVDVKGPDPNLS